MRRDMDLVREILLAVEGNEDGRTDIEELVTGYSQDRIYLHVELMEEHGLVDAIIVPASDGPEHRILACQIERLTWEGHDFLDKVRKDEIWERTKETCLKESGGLAIDILKSCSTRLIMQGIGA